MRKKAIKIMFVVRIRLVLRVSVSIKEIYNGNYFMSTTWLYLKLSCH